MRIGEAGVPIVLTFVNEDGSNHDISSYNFKLRAKTRQFSPDYLFELTEGVELTVFGADNHKLSIAPTALNATQKPATNFWLLYSDSEDHTWLNGPLTFHNGEFDGLEDTDDIIVSTSGTPVTITITAPEIDTTGLVRVQGVHDASTNLFPTTSALPAGSVLKGHWWKISVAGVLGGYAVPAGAKIMALSDTPGQTNPQLMRQIM